MNKLTILVTTIGGLTSPDSLIALRNNGEREIKIIGCDAYYGACGKNFVDKFEISPNSALDENTFINFIKNIIKKYNVDVILPCGNEDNLALSKIKDEIDIPIVVGNYEDLIIAYDKGKVYSIIEKELPENAPKYHIVNNWGKFLKSIIELGYPNNKIIIKPRFGRGGRGVYILSDISNKKDIFKIKPTNEVPLGFFETTISHKEKFDDLIVMECLQDPFYSAYSLCLNGNSLITLEHIREWGNASQTYRGKVSYNIELEEICTKIIKIFNLTFTNNMELATNINGKIILFDLNPRLGASSGIDKDIGINFPYMSVKLALNENITINKSLLNKSNRFYRYFTQWWEML